MSGAVTLVSPQPVTLRPRGPGFAALQRGTRSSYHHFYSKSALENARSILRILVVQEELEHNFIQFFQTLGICSSAVNWHVELKLTCSSLGTEKLQKVQIARLMPLGSMRFIPLGSGLYIGVWYSASL